MITVELTKREADALGEATRLGDTDDLEASVPPSTSYGKQPTPSSTATRGGSSTLRNRSR